MSQIPQDPGHESDGNVTEEGDHDMSVRKHEPSLTLSGDLSCGICLNVLRHPYTIVPCLHTFDKSCLSQWWKNHSSCPVCKERAKSARFSYQLNGILEYHRQTKKRRITKDEKTDEEDPSPKTSEEIFPYGSSYGQAQSQESDGDTDSDAEPEIVHLTAIHLPAIMPAPDGVLWPCVSCMPGNDTGYTCTTPIPQPPMEEVTGTGPIPSPPSRGDARLALVDPATRQFRSLAAMQHRHCDCCTAYLPVSGLPVQCRICGVYTCSQIDPGGCPRSTPPDIWDPIILVALRDANQRIRHGQITDFSQLWGWCEYPLGSNTTERRRFMDHMSAGARTPDEAHTEFEESVKRWLVQQSRAPPRRQRDSDNVETDSINVIADRLARESEPTEQLQRPVDLSTPAANATLEEQEDPNWRVCFQCLTRTARSHFYRWWTNERATGDLDPTIARLDHCWYGRECRTQHHNANHAARYNHVCENTSVARGRAPAQAPAAAR